jgi:pimeloyl-ACP methyl ester carboxylesterase
MQVMQPAKPVKIMPPNTAYTPTDEEKTRLRTRLDVLEKAFAPLKNKKRATDIAIFIKAVDVALAYNEFQSPREIATAERLLDEGEKRLRAFQAGKTPWLQAEGLVPLGYVSRIDQSIQPYGIVRPANPTGRLDVFFHGRGETLTELSFVDQRMKSAGEFTPPGAIVMHPYGRFCNANRFAGEVDLLEAIDDLKQIERIDENRIVVRGFSMGGAACWQYATHHSDKWVAAAPGAGFTESAVFTSAFRPGTTPPPDYVQKLWHLYDSTDYAVNIANLPTVAYSGEIDGQRQAAEAMLTAFVPENIVIPHVIGAKAGHFYTADAKKEINALLDPIVERGRNTLPDIIRFTTFSLRYNKMHWVTVEGMTEHFTRTRVEAKYSEGVVTASTENVTHVTFAHPKAKRVVLDGQELSGSHFERSTNGKWRGVKAFDNKKLRKRPGLQGPIDDCWYDSFVFVAPTGVPFTPDLGAWTQAEQERAISEWRRFYRGDAVTVKDTEVSKEILTNSNLVLWGDPQSNQILRKIANKLPIRWDKNSIKVGNKSFNPITHAPIFIAPNPLNSNRYVVINTCLTFRDYIADSNAHHASKLPDWAIREMTPRGEVLEAGFFDEQWRVK